MVNERSTNNSLKRAIAVSMRFESTPVLIVFIVIAITIFIIEPRFLSFMNIKNLLLQNAITGMIALGMTFVMISGGIDLSVGWQLSLIGVTMAHLFHTLNLPTYLVVIIAFAMALAGSGLMGFLISRTKIEPFIISLGFMTVYQGLTYIISKARQENIGERFQFLGSVQLQLGMAAWLFILLAIISGLVLKYTKYGRRAYAVGGNEQAAYLAGINVRNFKMSTYIINGLLVTLGAMCVVSRLAAGNPLMGSGKEIETIAAVVVGGTALSGGRGNIFGVVLGTLLIGMLSNGMNIIGIDPYWKYAVTGIVIIGAVVGSYYSRTKGTGTKGAQ